ncbi:MAG: hypothetical protein GTN89_16015 [Acidobacteria bacterium]|nr:hypothetical protein [Acidobacteriota bacterium]NIO60743.1 hypothetical protein [Acidobacteriota bacterium]NIQ31809.1 hypothetical protein [Acidobacteriota bacterium]NIQ87470.1 hypothetical protein [Acidobacteriota bacterium]
MDQIKQTVLTATLALLVCVAPSCKGKSPYEKALEDRARWNVLALDWTQNDEHVVLLSTRVNGPPNSPLDRLTVRIELRDASGATVKSVWHTYDLSELPRGGPKDITVRIPADGSVEVLGVDRMLNPADDDRAGIVELEGF